MRGRSKTDRGHQRREENNMIKESLLIAKASNHRAPDEGHTLDGKLEQASKITWCAYPPRLCACVSVILNGSSQAEDYLLTYLPTHMAKGVKLSALALVWQTSRPSQCVPEVQGADAVGNMAIRSYARMSLVQLRRTDRKCCRLCTYT
eukprot:6184932-Pleurochrysis_carterae.AAC.2